MKMGTTTPVKRALTALMTTALLVGCGGQNTDYAVNAMPQQQMMMQQQGASPEMGEILTALQEIRSDIQSLKQGQYAAAPAAAAYQQAPAAVAPAAQQQTAQTAAAATAQRTATAAPAAATPTASQATAAAPRTAAPAAPKVDPKAKGRSELNQVLQSINGIAGYDAIVDKYEIGIQNADVSQAKIRVTGGSPHRVKIEIVEHPEKKGLKVAYNGGDSQINIRPNGVLSLVSVSKPMNDPLVMSPNNLQPDQIDFYAMAKRMANPGYEAQLVGKTSLGGKTIHILKVQATSSNDLLSAISHEYIGFDPTTHQLLMWEAYSSQYQGGQKAFLRMTVNTFNVLSSVTESQLKV